MKKFQRKSIYLKIEKYLYGFKKKAVKLGAIKSILLIIDILTPLLFKLLVDNVMIDRQIDKLKYICIGYIAAYVISTFMISYQNILLNKMNKYTFNIRYKLWKNYTSMPAEVYQKYNPGDLKNRIDSDTDAFKSFITEQTIDYYFYWIIAFVNGAVLLFINYKLALFGFVMIPLSFWMTKWLGTKLKKAWEIQRATFGKYEGWLQGSIQGWKEVKALNLEKSERRKFTSYWHILSKQIFAGRMYWFGNRCFIAIKDFFITKMNLYFLGGLLIINGEITIGSLLVFMKYYDQLFNSIGSINDLDIQLNSVIPSMHRVIEALEFQTENRTEIITKENFSGNIEFKNLSFKYKESKKDVLKNINFKITKGERIAVVGRSGSGKTTLIKLLLGLYDSTEGDILIDNKSIKNINPRELHKNVGVVMQDSFLFNMTIRDNLLLAKGAASEKEIKDACRMAYIDEFIESLPKGYETLIGEKGIKLSGGQKQRLAIAKVLLSAPNIIIFDEATSSLDHESEKFINKAIENISKGRTIIIIAHRFASVYSADRIVILNDGEIDNVGSHEELLNRNEIYDTLFKKQCEGY